MKQHLKLFFTYYPAWGCALSLLLGSLCSWKLCYASIILFAFKNLRHLIVAFLIGVTCQFFQAKKLPYLAGEIEGVFHPCKEIIKPGFYGYQTYIEGYFKTPHDTYILKLLKKDQDTALDKVCALKLITAEQKWGIKSSVLSSKEIKNASLLFKFRKFLTTCLKEATASKTHDTASCLLFALLTGRLESRLLSIQFAEHGLSHILALSGFHLTLLFGLTQTLFRKLVRLKCHDYLSLAVLALYTLFIGRSCSIIRAFFMCFFSFFNMKITGTSAALHNFSLSLIATSLICAHQVKEPAFGLTFSATCALILFSDLYSRLSKKMSSPLNDFDRASYQIFKLFALQLFVFISTLPFVLFYFGKIQASGLIFNLFYPFLISLFMMSSTFALLIKIISPTFGQILLDLCYSMFDLSYEFIKKPITKLPLEICFNLTLAMLLTWIFVFLMFVFCISKKKQVL